MLVGAALTPEARLDFQTASRRGPTSRPFVVGPVGDTATVLDCELAGEYWLQVESGEPLPPNEISPAGPGRIVEFGISSTFVRRDGRWLFATGHIDPVACA